MARRREPTSRSSQRRSADGRRRGLRLATFGTLIGIATSFVTIALGAFDLRDKVGSVDANEAAYVSTEYTRGVGNVCDELEETQVIRSTEVRGLGRRLKHTEAFARQRFLVLDFVQSDLDRADHTVAAFAGLQPPTDIATRHEAVAQRWKRNVGRLRAHRDGLEVARTRTAFVGALAGLDRSLIEAESQAIEAQLHRLGGPQCDIAQPPRVPRVSLPPPRKRAAPPADPGNPPTRTSPDPNAVPPNPNAVPPNPNAMPPNPNAVPPDANVVPPKTRIPPLTRPGP